MLGFDNPSWHVFKELLKSKGGGGSSNGRASGSSGFIELKKELATVNYKLITTEVAL